MASGGGRDKGRRVHSACAPVSLVAVPGLRVGVPVGRAWPSGACPASPARAAALRPCQFPPMGRGTASSRTRACVTALIAFLYSGRAQPQKPIVASLPCAASLAPRRVCVCGPLLRGGETAQVQHVSAAKPRPQPPWRCGGASASCGAERTVGGRTAHAESRAPWRRRTNA
ncbi:hypothetical protein, conserved in T. vivax [Trypanosoma vivax Y486]|uniref:Uncharacterized protein n=1 Tax=Trypanosoma vivax (strain Y486) TaxID=1055687 RepID=F9WQ57_TRYVY|nr:hypothetical protein, conserved in T. vivax [Trypanosoma vivax Y486]|eukprot:CCD19684.1 hypothetical protein, conserved in T. vivax [Trypanosoma vivax Y486]